MTQTTYKCGCVADGDNVVSFCPVHNKPVSATKRLKLAQAFGWACSMCGSPGDPCTGMCTSCGTWKASAYATNRSRPPKPQKRKENRAKTKRLHSDLQKSRGRALYADGDHSVPQFKVQPEGDGYEVNGS